MGQGKVRPIQRILYFEACEYRRHFLNYSPDYCVMTNIDFDHPDYFKSVEDVVSAFQTMAKQVNKAIIAAATMNICKHCRRMCQLFIMALATTMIFKRNRLKTRQKMAFDAWVRGDLFGSFVIPGFGDHNVKNALSVIALCHYEGIGYEDIVST